MDGGARAASGGPSASWGAEDAALRLADGRRLGYAQYGTPDGIPLVAFHGTPGSRLMLEVAAPAAGRLGVRLIAPDRPGFGLSDPQPGRRLSDWPDDVVALADALGLGRFAVAGLSGGGPYAAACAWKIPERLTAVGIVSGMGPVDDPAVRASFDWRHRVAFAVARHPWLLRRAMALVVRLWWRSPEHALERLHTLLPPVDRPIAARPEVYRVLHTALGEAFHDDGRATADEIALFARPWGFRLEEIAIPVRLWHGEVDAIVPVTMGRVQAAAMPACRAEFIPGAGHHWMFDHIDELLVALTRAPA